MKRYKHYFSVTIILLLCGNVYGQLGKADKKFENFAYVDAREIYKEAVEDGKASPALLQKLGDAYYFTAEYRQASTWYGQLIASGADVSADYYFRYAQALKSINRYDEADKVMNTFDELNGSDTRGEMFRNERDYLKEIEKQSGRFEVSTLQINTELQDFSPSFYGDRLVFSSNREGSTGKLIHNWNDQPFLDLYITNNPMNAAAESVQLDPILNSNYHESSSVFTEDGQVMYFTRNNLKRKKLARDKEGTTKLKLYRSYKENNKWSKPEELPFNSDVYNVAHPALSPNGSILYFASDMPGTKGLSDLWMVAVNADGTFGEPTNLGDEINTASRETFPFVSSENKLYFATDGHVGLGGLDVFVAELDEQGNSGAAYNVGRPVNSSADDFGLILKEDTGNGFFSSNRGTGLGNDDIYALTRIEALITGCSQQMAGVTRNAKTNEILGMAKVTLLDKGGKVVSQVTSDIGGNFAFEDVDCGSTYAIRAEKLDHDPAEIVVTTDNETGKGFKRDLYLNPGIDLSVGTDLGKTLALNPIYFDLDKSNIRPDAALELERVIAVLKQYPSLKIDVRSHTDSRSGDVYNLKLSQRRNVQTLRYIVERGGISASRLTGNGYGETRLLNACGNGIPCNEDEHQMNRRSEFIIVER